MHDERSRPSFLRRNLARASVNRRRTAFSAAVVGAVLALPAIALGFGAAAAPDSTTFSLFPNPANIGCLAQPGHTPTAKATVKRGHLNDTLTLKLSGFKPGLAFDMFTVQNSNQNADGSPVAGFANFGMAWYQSDIEIGDTGKSTTVIKTILLDQIFGFDPAVALGPTNTFNLGFWFNNPNDASHCGFTGFTPFNGEHHAGPLAFITRPDATTKLGPLCTNPDTSVVPAVCNP